MKGNLTLREVLSPDPNDFKPKLIEILNTTNETLINLVLDSNPNFNYLYSSYSPSYYEPLLVLTIADVPQNLINILYGPELDMIDSNRFKNQVSNSSWLREQMCTSNKNFLLRSDGLNEHFCSNLTDEQMSKLFTTISEDIDWTYVKRKVIINYNYE